MIRPAVAMIDQRRHNPDSDIERGRGSNPPVAGGMATAGRARLSAR